MALTTVQNQMTAMGNSGASYEFVNRIINGAMVIDQRNAGASSSTINTYTVDRWVYYASQSGKLGWQQNSGSVTPPAGFINYLGFASASAYSIVSSDYFIVRQPIEGLNIADLAWGTANASPVTLSFWVRSSITGTFGGSLKNSGSNRSYPFSYTISSANTWTYATVNIPGDTTGTWLTTNGVGINLNFSLGVGSTYSGSAGSWAGADYLSTTGAQSVVGTNGATWYITGVQLEKGTTASAYDFRDYGRELAMCQRYCQVWGAGSSQMLGVAWEYASTASVVTCLRPVQMRTAPSLTYSAVGDWQVFNGGAGNYTATGISQNRTSINSMSIEFTVSSGLTVGQAGAVYTGNSSARIYESAEL